MSVRDDWPLDDDAPSFADKVEAVRGSLWLIAAAVLVAIAVAALYVQLAPKTYEARASLLVTPISPNDPLYLGLGLVGSDDNARVVTTVAALADDPAVARDAKRRLHDRRSVDDLLGKVRADPVAGSNVVTITAKSGNARDAQRLADGFAQALIAVRTARLHDRAAALLPELVATLRRHPNGVLEDRVSTLRTLEAAPDPTVQFEVAAERPDHQSRPRVALTMAVAAVIGVLVGVGGAFMRALVQAPADPAPPRARP